jgi:predicted enzyme related to lactoylglutathione lyase
MLCHAKEGPATKSTVPVVSLSERSGSMPNPVVHWEIMSNDKSKGQELQRFYSELFGWKIDADNPYDYGMVDTQTERGINGAVGPSEGVSRVSIYVEVDDPQAYLDKAVNLGATMVMPVTEIPGAVTMAMFADPDGHITGIIRGGIE